MQVGVVKSKEDCYAICSIKKLDGKLADGATIDVKTNTNCYCEFGMTKRNTNKKWTSAFIIRSELIFCCQNVLLIIYSIRYINN